MPLFGTISAGPAVMFYSTAAWAQGILCVQHQLFTSHDPKSKVAFFREGVSGIDHSIRARQDLAANLCHRRHQLSVM
jgi:hypothetical protein